MNIKNIFEILIDFEKNGFRHGLRRNNLTDLFNFLNGYFCFLNEYNLKNNLGIEEFNNFLEKYFQNISLQDVLIYILNLNENSEENSYGYFYNFLNKYIKDNNTSFIKPEKTYYCSSNDWFINFHDDFKYTIKNINNSPNKREKIFLTKSGLFTALYLYYIGRLERKDLIFWANYIKNNKNIVFESSYNIKNVILQISNFEKYGFITRKIAKNLLINISEDKFLICLNLKSHLGIFKYISEKYLNNFINGKSYHSLVAFDIGYTHAFAYDGILFDRHKLFKFNNYIIQETFGYDYCCEKSYFHNKALMEYVNNNEFKAYSLFFELMVKFENKINLGRYILSEYRLGNKKNTA